MSKEEKKIEQKINLLLPTDIINEVGNIESGQDKVGYVQDANHKEEKEGEKGKKSGDESVSIYYILLLFKMRLLLSNHLVYH